MSPYGFSKKLGGDSPSNDAKMEKCVVEVMAQGHSKISAIRICKAQLQKHEAIKRAADKS